MPKIDENLDQIIKLKLRKPADWKWELNTSYSSPHIPLPIIQLYDSKNNLLIQTKPYDRRSWGNNTIHYNETKLPQRTKSFTPSYNSLTTSDRIKIKERILKKSTSDASNKTPYNYNYLRKSSTVNTCDIETVNSERGQNKYFLRSSKAGTLLLRKETINEELLKSRRRRESARLSVLSSSSDEEENLKIRESSKRSSSRKSSKSSRANEISSTSSFNTINQKKYRSFSNFQYNSKYIFIFYAEHIINFNILRYIKHYDIL